MPIYEDREALFNSLGTDGFSIGALEDRLLLYLIDQGYTAGSLEDRFKLWLEVETSSTGSLPDLLRKKYIDAGYSSLGEALAEEAFLGIARDFFNGIDISDFTFTGGPNVTADNNSILQPGYLNLSSITGGRWAPIVAEGAILGNELVTNGEFDTDSDWTKGIGWTIGSGVASGSGETGYSLYQENIFTVGKTYQVTIEMISWSAGAVRLWEASQQPQFGTGIGTQVILFTPLSSKLSLLSVGFTGSIDNVSVKEVIPQWLDTDIQGNDLYASTPVRGTKLYTDADPEEFKRFLSEPARTNKVTCVKANPTDITNIAKSGDAAATLTVVDDVTELAVAGLGDLCDGNVYKLDNSGNETWAKVLIDGLPNSTNEHSYRVYVRGTGTINIGGGNGEVERQAIVLTSSYQEIIATYTPISTLNGLSLIDYSVPGAVCYFILPQLEEGTFATSIIIGDDSATSQTRTATLLSGNSAGVLRGNNIGIWGQVIPSAFQDSGYPFGLRSDASNELFLRKEAGVDNRFTLGKRVSGTLYTANNLELTHSNTPFQYQAYLSSSYGMGLRLRVWLGLEWGAWSSWATNANTADAPIASTYEIGSKDGGSHFAGNFQMLRTFWHSDPRVYMEAL